MVENSQPPVKKARPPMRHKREHLNGWREITVEIGIVVVGILIALGLDQAVAAYHDRQRTNEAI